MSENKKDYGKWTQNGLLSIIVVLMMWFITDNAAFKKDVVKELKSINLIQTEQFLDNVRKDAKQDLLIEQNKNGVAKNDEDIDGLKKDTQKIKTKVGLL